MEFYFYLQLLTSATELIPTYNNYCIHTDVIHITYLEFNEQRPSIIFLDLVASERF